MLGAAAYSEFPPCDAVIEHVPGATGLTAFPTKIQIDVELLVRVTVRPEEAEAVSA